MSDPTYELLACHLWDLRAQCEHNLRVLTESQRLLAHCTRGNKSRGHPVIQDLRREIAKLVPLVEVALQTAKACSDQAAALDGDAGA